MHRVLVEGITHLGAWGQVVSFNMGSLGFLTNHQYADFKADLAGVISGSEPLEECSPEGDTVWSPPPQEIGLETAWGFVLGHREMNTPHIFTWAPRRTPLR